MLKVMEPFFRTMPPLLPSVPVLFEGASEVSIASLGFIDRDCIDGSAGGCEDSWGGGGGGGGARFALVAGCWDC
jgi:hypothetical protein